MQLNLSVPVQVFFIYLIITLWNNLNNQTQHKVVYFENNHAFLFTKFESCLVKPVTAGGLLISHTNIGCNSGWLWGYNSYPFKKQTSKSLCTFILMLNFVLQLFFVFIPNTIMVSFSVSDTTCVASRPRSEGLSIDLQTKQEI